MEQETEEDENNICWQAPICLLLSLPSSFPFLRTPRSPTFSLIWHRRSSSVPTYVREVRSVWATRAGGDLRCRRSRKDCGCHGRLWKGEECFPQRGGRNGRGKEVKLGEEGREECRFLYDSKVVVVVVVMVVV